VSTADGIFDAIVSDPEVERRAVEILRLASECCPDDGASFLVGTGLGEWVTRGWSDADIHRLIDITLVEIRAFIARELVALELKGQPPS
jgi:alkylation response protein AidB-like acyl-CoA dehydrogenase